MIKKVIEIAVEAGEKILEIYEGSDFEVEYKNDDSPLTIADKRAHEIIEQGLQAISDYPILSEEGAKIEYGERKAWEHFWMVDPLDGTKEFVKRNGEFTVNIALIYQGRPILGVVFAPVLGEVYYAQKDKGAYLLKEDTHHKLPMMKSEGYRVVASKSHLNEETKSFIETLGKERVELTSIGSSLKFCLVAKGEADIYPRVAPTMEWDTAAADIVVVEAGGSVVEFYSRETLQYNKENLLNPYFIASL